MDCRSEELIWVIRLSNELNAYLEYKMFPLIEMSK